MYVCVYVIHYFLQKPTIFKTITLWATETTHVSDLRVSTSVSVRTLCVAILASLVLPSQIIILLTDTETHLGRICQNTRAWNDENVRDVLLSSERLLMQKKFQFRVHMLFDIVHECKIMNFVWILSLLNSKFYIRDNGLIGNASCNLSLNFQFLWFGLRRNWLF